MRPEARQSITRADVRGLDLPEHPRRRPCSGSSPARRIALDAADGPERRPRRCLVPVGSRWLVTTASSGPRSRLRSTAMASRAPSTDVRVRDTTDRRGPYHRCQHEPPGGSTGQDPDRERRRAWQRDARSAATSSSRVLGSPEFADVLRLRSVMRPEARQSITHADVRGLDLPEHPRRRPCSGSSPARRIALDAADGPERRPRRCLVPVGSRWLVTTASSGPRSRLRSTAMTASRAPSTDVHVRDITDRRGPYHRCQHEPPGGSTGQDPDRERRRAWQRDARSAATSLSGFSIRMNSPMFRGSE
jgi:hypothetical protein